MGTYSVFGRRPMVGRYKSTVTLSPLERVSSVWPVLLVEVFVILVSLRSLTCSFLRSFSAKEATCGGTPTRSCGPAVIWGV